jgi:uncharacterized OsmC-like protein
MIEAKALWTDHDRFLGQASSGHALVVDAGSEKSASSPMELVLIGLCACTASDVIGILRKKRELFTSLEVRATAERAETFPKVLYQYSSDLSRWRERDPQGNGGCRSPFEREVLLSVGHVGEDCQD